MARARTLDAQPCPAPARDHPPVGEVHLVADIRPPKLPATLPRVLSWRDGPAQEVRPGEGSAVRVARPPTRDHRRPPCLSTTCPRIFCVAALVAPDDKPRPMPAREPARLVGKS